jgi:hypothetical protein
MKTIIVKTQSELDALPKAFDEWTVIEIRSEASSRIYVNGARGNSSVVAWGNSSVVAWGNSSVEARGNSSVEAWGNSSVVAWGNSSVEARGNSSVVAWGNSSVEARGNSSVVARGNSSVVARGNSSVVAWENSSVEAWGNSSVVARGNSSVVAWENSSVEAWGNCAVRIQSSDVHIILWAYAVAWLLRKAKDVVTKSTTAQVITPERKLGVPGWMENEGVEEVDGRVTLYKRVSHDLKTQEGTEYETIWQLGEVVDNPKPALDLTSREGGPGKFHACSTTYFCNEFRSTPGDRYIAVEVAVADMHVWPDADYPHKAAFSKCRVIGEVDRMGRALK